MTTSAESGPVIGSRDRLTDIKAAQGPLQPTAIDAMGIERIVGPAVDDNWRPAQVEPHPDAIAHLEKVAAAEAERHDERLASTQVPAAQLGGGAGSDKKPTPATITSADQGK